MLDPSEFTAWLRAQGGVAHTRTARVAGFSKYDIDVAVLHGAASRVRRSWLVGPSASPWRHAAASVGGRLTCLSAAAECGLWTPEHQTIHVAVSATASRLESAGMRLHYATGPAPVARTSATEPILNVLFHIARCVPRLDALAVWESALNRKVVDSATLSRVVWRSTAASALSAAAPALSDSGIETVFRELMASIGVTVRQQVWVDGHPLDALIGDRLGIQLDGFAHHSSARDRRRDLRADARLVLRGYTILRFDYQQVLFDPAYVIETISMAIAQGLHLAGRPSK
ncbi:endonuclease domain-containing protein [Microbacterium sp. NPDC078428]|uniref:endonuclease domain-containing protein n=1 Tax=Microbacterium sp. NPDC078428 TaxID=3364190 RepID=UPI0037C77A68